MISDHLDYVYLLLGENITEQSYSTSFTEQTEYLSPESVDSLLVPAQKNLLPLATMVDTVKDEIEHHVTDQAVQNVLAAVLEPTKAARVEDTLFTTTSTSSMLAEAINLLSTEHSDLDIRSAATKTASKDQDEFYDVESEITTDSTTRTVTLGASLHDHPITLAAAEKLQHDAALEQKHVEFHEPELDLTSTTSQSQTLDTSREKIIETIEKQDKPTMAEGEGKKAELPLETSTELKEPIKPQEQPEATPVSKPSEVEESKPFDRKELSEQERPLEQQEKLVQPSEQILASIEQSKLTEEQKLIEHPKLLEDRKTVEETSPTQQSVVDEQLTTIERLTTVQEQTLAQHSKVEEQTKATEQFELVQQLQPVEQQKVVEEPALSQQPVEQPKPVEQTKSFERQELLEEEKLAQPLLQKQSTDSIVTTRTEVSEELQSTHTDQKEVTPKEGLETTYDEKKNQTVEEQPLQPSTLIDTKTLQKETTPQLTVETQEKVEQKKPIPELESTQKKSTDEQQFAKVELLKSTLTDDKKLDTIEETKSSQIEQVQLQPAEERKVVQTLAQSLTVDQDIRLTESTQIKPTEVEQTKQVEEKRVESVQDYKPAQQEPSQQKVTEEEKTSTSARVDQTKPLTEQATAQLESTKEQPVEQMKSKVVQEQTKQVADEQKLSQPQLLEEKPTDVRKPEPVEDKKQPAEKPISTQLRTRETTAIGSETI